MTARRSPADAGSRSGAKSSSARSRARSRRAKPDPTPQGPVRLQKLLAAAGHASRRGAELLIEQGRVTVNGKLAKVGDSADPAVDRVALDGETLILERPVYWMLHKARGVVTTARDTHGRPTVLDSIPPWVGRVFPVGRLDVDTEGLVLLTNDGGLAHALLHPSLGSEREYRVTVRGAFDERARTRIERGVRLDGEKAASSKVSKVRVADDGASTTFHLVMHEGKKRQIRRSLHAVGFPVKRLVRVRMGPLRLGKLARGQARELGDDECEALRKHRKELEGGTPAARRARKASRSRKSSS